MKEFIEFDRKDIVPWLCKTKVLPQHTDHAGVAWHGSYVNWLEEARIKALFDVGLSYSKLSCEGYEMPVVGLQIKYLEPLLHGDEVFINSWILPRRGVRLVWETEFLKNGTIKVAEAMVELVLTRLEKRKHKLLRYGTVDIENAFQALQKGFLNKK